jgi:hypothetical protein
MRLFLVLLQNRVKAYCVILFVGPCIWLSLHLAAMNIIHNVSDSFSFPVSYIFLIRHHSPQPF